MSARACDEQRPAQIVFDVAERVNPSVQRHDQRGWPRQNERRLSAGVGVLLKVFEECRAALVAIDTSQVQHVVRRDTETFERRSIRLRLALRFQPDPDHPRRLQPPPGPRGHKRFFFGREEQVSSRSVEKLLQDVEIDRGIFLSCRHQHGAVGHQWQPEVAGRIAEGPEEDEVVLGAARAQMLEQRGRIGTVRAEPRLFPFRRRAKVVEDFVAEIGEGLEVARPRYRKTLHAHAILCRNTRGIRICPCDVVARAGREDGDVVTEGETLSKLTAVHLGAARDAGAVALNDERELHVRSRGSRRPEPVDACRESSRTSLRSRVVSIASSCTHANSTWFTRRCRSKLSRLNS